MTYSFPPGLVRKSAEQALQRRVFFRLPGSGFPVAPPSGQLAENLPTETLLRFRPAPLVSSSRSLLKGTVSVRAAGFLTAGASAVAFAVLRPAIVSAAGDFALAGGAGAFAWNSASLLAQAF